MTMAEQFIEQAMRLARQKASGLRKWEKLAFMQKCRLEAVEWAKRFTAH